MSVTSHQQIQVLHVDDGPDFADLTRTFLEREDDRFSVQTATSATEGLDIISNRPPDCVVSDYNMPGMDGLEFLQTVREQYPDLPFILFTGKGSEEVASDAIAAGVTNYIQKGSGSERYALLANRIDNAVKSRREAERAERQEELMRLTEIAGNTCGFELDTETGEFTLTEGASRIFYAPEKENCDFEDGLQYFHPDDQEDIQQTVQRAVKTDERTQGTFRYQPPDEEQKLLELTYIPIATDENTTTLRGAVHDVTGWKKREQELEEFETIIKALTDAVYVLDEEGRFTYVNDEFVELVGYDRETILGSDPSLIKGEEAVDQAEKELGRLLSSDGPDTVTFEIAIQPRTGDAIACEDHMGVLPYGGETFDGSVGVLRDITEHKKHERKLEAQNERLEEFASIVSHDLRSPLNVAEGHLELAGSNGENEHLAKAVDAIGRSQALIDDLLTLAREGDHIDEIEEVDFAAVAEGSWQTVETAQATLNIGGPAVIKGDRNRIQQLLENLYRNAVEHGGDDVTVQVGAMDDGFYVADTGSGIPESIRDEIFEAGYSTEDHGTGFGLRIVEQIARAHGWEASVIESEQGGARFEFTGVYKGE